MQNNEALQNILKQEDAKILGVVFGNLEMRCKKGFNLQEALEKTCEFTIPEVSTAAFRLAKLLGITVPMHYQLVDGEEHIIINEQEEELNEQSK